MSDQTLTVKRLGKAFRTYRSEFQRALSWVGVHVEPSSEHWVLRDVSFSVAAGEAIAIVGKNGAGKSTLLKLIAGTLRPTEGEVQMRGSLAAILELGMGFNPELTGRENAIHSAGLMGLGREEIQRAMPAVEEFANIGDYFNQPVRTYSSGMQLRVAFAVATASRPSLLIVDEALSVGDTAFQRKSLHRIEQFLELGTTLVFVSHGTETIKRVCNRALWINDTHIVADGSSKDVCEAYERYMLSDQSDVPPAAPRAVTDEIIDQSLLTNIETQYGDGRAEIFDFVIHDHEGVRANVILERVDFFICYRVRFLYDCTGVHFGMMIKTIEGVCVYAINTGDLHPVVDYKRNDIVQVKFQLTNNLVPGIYYLNCGANHLTPQGRQVLHRRLDVAAIRISSTGRYDDSGIANLRAQISVVLTAA